MRVRESESERYEGARGGKCWDKERGESEKEREREERTSNSNTTHEMMCV